MASMIRLTSVTTAAAQVKVLAFPLALNPEVGDRVYTPDTPLAEPAL